MSIIGHTGYRDTCPCCLTPELIDFIEPYEISSSSYTSITKSIKSFLHLPFFCANCGHIFNACPPDKKTLEDYYKDQYPHFAEDYDVRKRISWISRWVNPSRKYSILDYGGNLKRNFYKELVEHGFEVDVIDISTSMQTKSSYDIITSYFLLEHIVDLDETFLAFKSLAQLGSVLILEVPGSEIYDRDCSGLLYEHQQHFNVCSLEVLASRYGFRKLEISWELCSINFGFVASFIYVEDDCLPKLIQFEDARNNYILGRNMQLSITTQYPQDFYLKNKLDKFSVLIFWGINMYFEGILNYVKDAQKIIALDSNSDKFSHVNYGIECYLPDNFLSNLPKILASHSGTENMCFIVTASAHSDVICPKIAGLGPKVLVYDPISL